MNAPECENCGEKPLFCQCGCGCTNKYTDGSIKCSDCGYDVHIDEKHAPRLCISVLKGRVSELEGALREIARNNTDDRSIYTMGCDCHEVAQKALANANRASDTKEGG